MRARGCFALLGCLIVALLPTPAAAGGWWSSINPDKYYVAAGQDFKAETQFLFASSQEAQIARTEGGFYAYLVTGLDRQMFTDAMNEDFSPDWWSLQGATAIRVGTVAVTGGSSNLARARARMSAPEVAPGVYQLMFCDAGCVHPMGSVVPATVTVVEDPFVARLANRVQRLDFAEARHRYSLQRDIRRASRGTASDKEVAALRQDLATMGGELRQAGAIFGTLDPRIASVEARINGAEKRIDDGGMPGYAWLGIGLALGAGLMLMQARRSRTAPVWRESPPLDHWSPAVPSNGGAAEKDNDRELEPVP